MLLPYILDPRFDKQALLAADDVAFSALMEEVDASLKAEEVAIFQRPLQAIPRVCKKGGFSLILGEPLSERISVWFSAQYGDRIRTDLSLGYGPVVIRGDLYKMQSPWLVAGGRIVCIAGRVEPSGAVPIVNVLDFIAGLTSQRANDLKTSELKRLQTEYVERQRLFVDLRTVQNDGAFHVALGDLNSSVDFLFQERPQVGQARWACLQAVEKFLKGWIAKQGAAFQTTHSLTTLKQQASSLGLTGLSDADLAAVQCAAGVRYGEIAVSNDEAVAAFNAALRCCALIASEVTKTRSGANPKPRSPNPNTLTKEQFLSLKTGDVLRSDRLQLTITGIAQEAPRAYRTLVHGATRETMIVEDDFQSFVSVKRGQIWLPS